MPDPSRASTISLRVHYPLWSSPERLAELGAALRDRPGVVEELAFFTAHTHPPLPLPELEARATAIGRIVPEFKRLGLAVGINHLATIGHLDENLARSLDEPWQRLTAITGETSRGCYCPGDPSMRAYIDRCYRALAAAAPDFIWIDDDVRLEGHGPINACFCDRCLAEFSAECGRTWSRESLREAFASADRTLKLTTRKLWLAHNRAFMARILSGIRAAVDAVDPAMALGLMTGEIAWSGSDYGAWAQALAGPRTVAVKWRPGGGFYEDQEVSLLLGKAHSIGRQVARLPPSMRDIQSEHENFPYQPLKKSRQVFAAEIAAYIGAGCTGSALNPLTITADPIGEYDRYFERVRDQRGFYERLASTFGRSPCEGLWVAQAQDHHASRHLDGDWASGGAWTDVRELAELAQIGLPYAYDPAHASLAALAGDACLGFSHAELEALLARGVMLDATALTRLNELGFTAHTGFSVASTVGGDVVERFTPDGLNGAHGGRHRDCRPGFFGGPPISFLIPVSGARVLSEGVDFAEARLGALSGVYENALGGRVAVFGYCPWNGLQTLAKSTQMRSVSRWLSREALPAWIDSYERAALWCRRDARGRLAMLLINASLDAIDGLTVAVRDAAGAFVVTRGDGRTQRVEAVGTGERHGLVTIDRMEPWEAVMVAAG